ncbi:hypothetical protein TNCV_38231 [Trichonephila clavipes]|nr:hypothetical protein TNCV_38231 [Trichonephila clavipes]
MRTRPCVCPLRFQFTECPGTGFKSFRWGRKAGNCNSNQSVVAWMYLKNSSHRPCTRRTLLFDQYDVIFLQVWLCVLPFPSRLYGRQEIGVPLLPKAPFDILLQLPTISVVGGSRKLFRY